MIKTLYFDFGNVIARFDHWRSVLRLAKFTDMTPAEIYDTLYDNDLERAFENGTISTAEYIREGIRQCRLTCSPEQFRPMFEDIFTLNTDVTDFIPKLATRYRILLASNTNDAHYTHYLGKFDETLSHFAALPASHLAKCRKPLPGFFEFCQQYAEAKPGECAFIDDLPENVAAGERHGWRGLHYRPGDDFGAKLKAAGIAT